MTVLSSTNRADLVGDGIQVVFPYAFLVLKSSHMTVYLDGVLQSASAYTVSGVGAPSGGGVTFVAPPGDGVVVTLLRFVPLLQEDDYTAGDRFPAEVHESALDQSVMRDQQQEEQLSRHLQYALIETPAGGAVLPAPVPNTIIGYDGDGELTNLGFTPGGAVALVSNPLVADLNTGGNDIVLDDGAEKGRLASDGTLTLKGVDVGGKLSWFHPMSDFGAVGDGVTDDTDAVEAAIAADVPLDWGSGHYRVTSEQVFTVASQLMWRADGAKIVYDPASHTYSCMTISLPDGAHFIRGAFTVDVGQNANVGLKFVPEVNGTDYPDLVLEDVTVDGTYRTSAFNDGDGIFVVGSFRTVDIIRPKIVNSHMAVGAGVPGVYGIFGITVSRNSIYAAVATTIRDAWIDKLYSDDPAYLSDQDGIRIFSRYGGSGTGGLNNPASGKVLGGFFRDIRGRSVKMQTEQGLISGLTLHRTTAANNGSAGALTQNADIEIQSGGCTVSDVEFQYDGFVPVRVIRCIQADDTVRWASPHIVSNIRGVVSGANSPDSVVMFSVQTSATAIEFQCLASNINVVAETPFNEVVAITTLSGVSSVIVDALLANCICPVDTSFLRVSDNATPKWVSIANVTNPRAPDADIVNVTNTLALRLSGLRGFVHQEMTVRAVETFTVSPTNDSYILSRNSTTQTITLPAPAERVGRTLKFKNIGSVAVNSASSNVQPIDSLTPGAALFPAASGGSWLTMTSNGVDWVILSRG